jgi:hypothetical protein
MYDGIPCVLYKHDKYCNIESLIGGNKYILQYIRKKKCHSITFARISKTKRKAIRFHLQRSHSARVGRIFRLNAIQNMLIEVTPRLGEHSQNRLCAPSLGDQSQKRLWSQMIHKILMIHKNLMIHKI